jgi:hypothetical protein
MVPEDLLAVSSIVLASIRPSKSAKPALSDSAGLGVVPDMRSGVMVAVAPPAARSETSAWTPVEEVSKAWALGR